MWKRTAKGITFTFHLAGINNQNFIMRDEQTGTFWQQISGRAISGPLAGSQLELVYSDELTFGLWRNESPGGTVLKPVLKYAGEYESKDWDVRMAKQRTVLNFKNTPLQSRDLVLGVESGNQARAYVVRRILSAKIVEDRLDGHPLLLVVGPDEKSIRAFRTEAAGTSEFYRKTDLDTRNTDAPKLGLFMDASTGSEWNFSGCAVSGKQTGVCLTPVPAVKDYWFDWRNYHPKTTIFGR